jgi:hypothetical protein
MGSLVTGLPKSTASSPCPTHRSMRELRHNKDIITVVGWICALQVKLAAAQETLNREHDKPRAHEAFCGVGQYNFTNLAVIKKPGLCNWRLRSWHKQ